MEFKCEVCGTKALMIRHIKKDLKTGKIHVLCSCPICLEFRRFEIK